jgi:tetratricopeptide (TPR) repeat protein
MNRFLATLVTLVGLPLALWAQPKSSNPEAQRAYQEGLAHLESAAGVFSAQKALASFQRAVALDPKFAAGHAQLSAAYLSLGPWFAYWSPERTNSQAVQAAEQAVSLDPKLVEAWLAKARAEAWVRWNWSAAEQAYQKALSLKPEHLDTLLAYVDFLLTLGRTKEADGLFQQARKAGIPPTPGNDFAVFDYRLMRTTDKKEVEKLIAEQQRKLDLQPPQAYWLWAQAVASTKAGKWTAAQRYLEQQIPLMEGDIVDEVALLGHVLGRQGRKAEALKQLARLADIEKSGLYVSPVLRAWIHIAVGDKDRAFAELDQALAQRAHRLGLGVPGLAAFYDPIRDDPRFAALLKKMNL